MEDMEVHDSLTALRDCLLHLSQGKVSEKKKQIEILKKLLQSSDTLQLLDKNSTKKKTDTSWRDLITWSKVFSCVRKYIQQEVERRFGKGPSSSRNWTDKASCIDCFKYVVRIVVKRNQSSVSEVIVAHILAVLSNPLLLDELAFDYTNVLVKDILSSPQMCFELPCDIFQDLLQCYCRLLKSPAANLEKGLLASTLYQILLCAYSQYDLKPEPLLEFLSSALGSIKNEKSSTYHEYLIKSMMVFCQNAGSSRRLSICALGENVFFQIINLWNTTPAESTKVAILEFCSFQFAIHHPRGAVDESSGALFSDLAAWKSILLNLYHLIIKEITNMCSNTKYSSRDNTLPDIIPVAVEVCAQVFQNSFCGSETISSSSIESCSGFKKRKVEVGFQALLDIIHEQSKSSRHKIVPWLRLLSAILLKYQQIVPMQHIIMLLNMLVDIHLSCIDIDVKNWLLTCCQVSVECCVVLKSNISIQEQDFVNCDWRRLWELGLKCVALMHQCHENGHKLLQSLLIHKLITPKLEFFNLYRVGSNNKVTSDSLRTLSIFLCKYSLPLVKFTSFGTRTENYMQLSSLHGEIISWLFQSDNTLDLTNCFSSFLTQSHVDAQTIHSFSSILTCLCMQDHKSALERFILPNKNERNITSWIKQLETELLQCWFETPLELLNGTVASTFSFRGTISLVVFRHINEMLLNISNKALETIADLQLNIVPLKLGLLIFLFIKNFHSCQAINEDEIFQSLLCNNFKSLIHASINQSCGIYTATQELNSDLYLESMVSYFQLFMKSQKNEANSTFEKWFLEILPKETQELLLRIACGDKKDDMGRSSLQKSGQSPSKCRSPVKQRFNRYMAHNLVDKEFDNITIGGNTGNESQTNKGFHLVDIDKLQNPARLQIFSADLLVKLCVHLPNDEKFSHQIISTRLLNVVQAKITSGLKNPEDVQLVLQFLNSVLQTKFLGTEEVNIIIGALRTMLKKFSKCSDVCAEIISVFKNLYPHLFSSCSSSPMTSEKDHTMHLLHVLWCKVRKNKCNRTVTFALAQALSELLKYDSCVHWKKADSDQSVSDGTPISIEYFQLLQNQYQNVKIFVASQAKYMFQTSNRVLLPTKNQNETFESVYLPVIEWLNHLKENANISSNVLIDKRNSSALPLLHFLCHVYISSNSCKQLVIFLMCKLIKDEIIPSILVTKALRSMSQQLGYPTVQSIIEQHFVYIANSWILSKYSMDDFPYSILEHNNIQEFYVSHYNRLVPLFVYHSDLKSLNLISSKVGKIVKDLLVECCPQILARIYSWNATNTCNETAEKCFLLLVNSASEEFISSCLIDNIDDIVIHLLNMLEEEITETDTQSAEIITMSSSSPHCITPLQFYSSLEVMKSKSNLRHSVVEVLCQKQDRVQKIVLAIQIQLSQSHSVQEEKQAILMLQVFIELLLPEFLKCLKNYNTFLLTEVVHCLIPFLTKRDHAIWSACVHILCVQLIQRLFEEVLPLCREEIGNLLPFIVSRLTPLVSDTKFGQKVLSFLNYLILGCSKLLEDHILLLNPFPDDDIFQQLREKHQELTYKNKSWNLEREFDHFCQAYKINGRTTLEGLKHLHLQLKLRKNELLMFLTYLQDKRLFFEDVATSRFHNLVSILVHICTQEVSSNEMSVEAGRCLGEIGPINLSTVVLQTSVNQSAEPNNSDMAAVLHLAYNNIFNLLTDYMKDDRIKLKVVVSNVLKSVFKLKSIQKFLSNYQNKLSWLKYMYPFRTKYSISCSTLVVSLAMLDQTSLWIPDDGGHSKWITNLVTTILKSGATKNDFFEHLTPICLEEPSFCSQILPYLIYAIVQNGDDKLCQIVSLHMSSFFEKLSLELRKLSNINSSSSSSPNVPCNSSLLSKASVQTMLSVMHFLRLQVKSGSVDSSTWTGLDVNYLLVAQGAQYCSAYFTAILFTELWCDSLRGQMIQNYCDGSVVYDHACSPMSVLNSQNQEHISLAYKILLDAYSSIGDSDGIHGCISIAMDCQSMILNHYVTEKKWDKLLKFYDKASSSSGVLKCLKECGLDHILQEYVHAQDLSDEPNAEVIEYQCECAWKMSKWDLPIPESENSGFQQHFYKSLQCINDQNESGFRKHLELSRLVEFQNLSHTSFESVRSILPVLSHLQMQVMLEDYSVSSTDPETFLGLQDKWKKHKEMPYADFDFYEPIAWLQCIILKQQMYMQPDNKVLINNELMKCLEDLSNKAREQNFLDVSSRAIDMLKTSALSSERDDLRWQVEEAKILWTMNEQVIASRILKSALSIMESFLNSNTGDFDMTLNYAKTLTLHGKWLSETCSENSATIMKDYLEKAIDVLESLDHLGSKTYKIWDAYLAIARYADKQYQSIVNHKKSVAFQTKQEIMTNAEENIKKLNSKTSKTQDENKTLTILKRQQDIDEAEMISLNSDQQQFLIKAIASYLVCLEGTDEHDLWVFRLTALWFHNLEDASINMVIEDHLQKIETYKFLPLMYQLAARMGTQTNEKFSKVLSKLIKNITLHHPHHALPVILSMSNADKDRCGGTSNKKSNTASTKKERMIAATKIVESLKKTKLSKLLKEMSALCNAYISLAYMSVDKSLKTGTIPSNEPIMKLKHLSCIPVITEDIKVDRSCSYNNLISIQSFHSEFRLCGGINVPKVIKCVGTDGVVREQLVKGEDDLRQDAVMQQVFSLVNCLLKENNETRSRKLHIRTYKVVPMSRRSGVLQWCEGTQVLSQYLTGPQPPGGAHQKYYPLFWSHLKSFKQMGTVKDRHSLKEKREVYDEICKNFPPVFRFFFLENFPNPSAWLERRQSYTKSVATSSMVGYILGLGDRHVNNILIDKHTAEVVHIDFGIAFEKGRVLTTPETVPFRLTRDIVDGMGFLGVEGVFKRCCEKTLEVLRESQDVLLTILEVLLYDPLYDWTVPATKSSLSATHPNVQLSPESVPNQEVNKLAERALMRLQQKLQGLEEGRALCISGQVNLLIQQAQDPDNLCKIYAGWQPFL